MKTNNLTLVGCLWELLWLQQRQYGYPSSSTFVISFSQNTHALKLVWKAGTYVTRNSILFLFQNCCDLLWETSDLSRKTFEGREFTKILRSLEQFIETVNIFETNCFFNLFPKVSKIWYIKTIRIQIGNNYWDFETYRKS